MLVSTHSWDLLSDKSIGGEEVVLGMAHRGHLNVMAHIAGQRVADTFRADLARLLKARYPLLFVESFEEQKELLRVLPKKAEIPTFPWVQVFSSGREVKGADGAKLYELWASRTTAVFGDEDSDEGGGSYDDENGGGSGGVGGGFGDAEKNRRVELAAMALVHK